MPEQDDSKDSPSATGSEAPPVPSRHTIRRLENPTAFPIAALEAVGEMREVLNEIERTSVQIAREKGASWEDLAIALGVSRQTLYQRHRNGFKPRK